MDIRRFDISGPALITPRRFGDARGWFSESWNRRALEQAGLYLPGFVQDNHSMSAQTGTLRGLHYQRPPHAQGKLVRCARGALLDVAIDARRGSPHYGRWVTAELTEENGTQLWVPPGFLHGFVTRAPDTEIIYKCTGFYSPEAEGSVRWDTLGIDWGVDDPVLSDKDAQAQGFAGFKTPFEYEG